jgi:hypothetical protein
MPDRDELLLRDTGVEDRLWALPPAACTGVSAMRATADDMTRRGQIVARMLGVG